MRQSIKFFATLKKGIQDTDCDEMVTWRINDHDTQVDIYRPKRFNQQTIMVIHGMGRLGNRDPRMKNICRQLSALGFMVLAPAFPTIQACLILEEQCDEITAVMHHALTQSNYCPAGKLSIMSISFSGSVATRAAAHPNVNKAIKGVLTIGYTPNGGTAIHDLLRHPEADSYGYYIALKNAYYLLDCVDPVIDAGFDALLKDDSTYMPDDHFEKHVASLSPTDQARVLAYFNDIQSRNSNIPKQLSSQLDYHHLKTCYDFTSLLHDLPFRLTIIQDDLDKILFTEHVETLAQTLPHSSPHVINITPILSHADLELSLKNIIAIFKTIRAFSGFIKSALN